MPARLDHLVVAARTLDEGVQWCEATLGLPPDPGGAHPLMGTHNRLLRIASPAFPRAYLEIIAIDAEARLPLQRRGRRWFDLDDPLLQADLARRGPRLVHFVAAVPDALQAVHALALKRIDRGEPIEASRDTPAGRLSWKITVREDGQRLFYGALPTLIEWGAVHPVDQLPDRGLALRSLALTHPRQADLADALRAIELDGVPVSAGVPGLQARIDTPRGSVVLQSKGL